MDEFSQFLRWVAETYYFHQFVYFDPDLPPTSKDRRRLRQAKQTMLDAFGTYMNKRDNEQRGFGRPWFRILNEGAINYGEFALPTQQFSINRIDPTNVIFFDVMTFLLLQATLAAVV